MILNQEMLPVFWGLLLVAALAWLFLSRRLYHELAANHPGIFNNIGQPKFIMPKSVTTNYRVMRFLLQKEYEDTHDLEIIRLSQSLRYVLFIFSVCLSGCLMLLAARLF